MMERNLDKEAFEYMKHFILLANADDKHSECCAILNIMKERKNMIDKRQEFIEKLYHQDITDIYQFIIENFK